MAVESWKKNRVWFTAKEGTAFTPSTTGRFEGRGRMTFPEPEWMVESDYNKLGSGEHGNAAALQAVGTPWSYTTQELSEIAYFLAYFQGNPDPVMLASGATAAYVHELKHLAVGSRLLPTFTIEYLSTSGSATDVIGGCVVNEFSVSGSSGGNGVVEATFSGWGNRHQVTNGAIVERAAGSISSGTWTSAMSSEPLVNYKAFNVWMADALESSWGKSSIDFSGEDLGSNLVNLTTLVNSFGISGSNGMTMADKLRAGGSGVINDRVRNDRRYTLEFALRKDLAIIDPDTLILNDTQKAFEFLFTGPYIEGSIPYGLDIFFPVVQVLSAPEDDASPIGKAYTTEVFEDSNGDSCLVYVQSAISNGYNA